VRQNRILVFFKKMHLALFIGLILFLNFILYFIALFFPPDASQNEVADMMKSLFDKIAIGVIAYPIIETLIFQTFIISTVLYLIRKPKYNLFMAIFFSALAFALVHTYNIYYFFMTFLSGITLAFAYYIARYKNVNPTLTVFVIHAVWNFLGFFIF
jgi:hypothetical protein